MKKFVPFCLILLLVNIVANAGTANSNAKANLSKRKTKAAVVKTPAENSTAEERLKAAEARALEAERRAQDAEAAALRATTDAKLAKEQAAEAKASAQQANETLAAMQQALARLEAAHQQPSTEALAVKKTEATNPLDAPAAKPAEVVVAKQSDTAQKPADGAVTTNSKLPVKIYGSLLVNASFADGGSNNIDVPLFGQKQGTSIDQEHENFNMTARQTRLGMRYEGKIFKDAKLTGVFEFDLFGGKPAISNGEQFDLFRLRLAYGRIDWKNDSLEAGQDWSVFAPLNPTTLASYAIPGFAGSGNLWYRMPQIRYEHREGDKSKFILTTAILDPNAGDNAGNPVLRPIGLGERGGLPALETRLGFTTPAHGKESSFGASGHYSRLLGAPGNPLGVTVRSPVDSYGVGGDFNVWLSTGVRVTGELFHGRALGIFSGNIIQAAAVIGGRARGINSTGGWFELHAEAPTGYQGSWKNFSANLGYGAEDNRNADLTVGLRNRNQTYLGNGQYKFAPNFIFAVEFRHIRTDWFNQPAARQRLNWANAAFLFSF